MKHLSDIQKFSVQGELLAPNGSKSNLPDNLYHKVRTAEFKNWFGDWENDPENASKIVDENGEPMVVYHGTPAYGFEEFLNTYNLPRASANETNNIGHWFVNDKEVAKKFMFDSKKGGVYEVFINVRNPKTFGTKMLNMIEVDQLEKLRKELWVKMHTYGWALQDMTPKQREDYMKYKEEDEKVSKQIKLLKSTDSFEQFMNYRDKYAEYIDGVKGEAGHWLKRMINTNKNEANKRLVQEFMQDQHDGIAIVGTEYDAREGEKVSQFVVFDSKNIKSTGARLFNPESKNINEHESIYKGMKHIQRWKDNFHKT